MTQPLDWARLSALADHSVRVAAGDAWAKSHRDDIVQEALTDLWRWSLVSEIRSPDAAAKVLGRRTVGRLRARKDHRALPQQSEQWSPVAPEPDDPDPLAGMGDEIQRALAQLLPADAALIVALHCTEESIADIARRFGINKNTAHCRAVRIRARLRVLLGGTAAAVNEPGTRRLPHCRKTVKERRAERAAARRWAP